MGHHDAHLLTDGKEEELSLLGSPPLREAPEVSYRLLATLKSSNPR